MSSNNPIVPVPKVKKITKKVEKTEKTEKAEKTTKKTEKTVKNPEKIPETQQSEAPQSEYEPKLDDVYRQLNELSLIHI